MADEAIPSISSGVVGSRFVSQSDIEAARTRREEQWKAAYARLGQEPPPPPQEDAYDGRSLAEKLAANRAAKQEEWEEKTKLANQFRALEEDEIMFLDSVRERQEIEERERKVRDGEELKSFREAVAAKVVVKSPPPVSTPESVSAAAPKITPVPVKKPPKVSLKGVIVKKKPKTASEAKAQRVDHEDASPDPKRRKVGLRS
ncbi:N-terminal domain of NEFA-interacting nuclear protein NIP30-domain-containing protein [Multifurca ochricompacta]|uniref:N-terminal domain of NEFA-interacting nuclear protein NIP30-domain-containing protein n=1 Tax=Multifurca ochricompacta TaxID=376703 RepID=A0AAD4MD01_9AGAM|nr:N-terminal domain of NEFA-interacting nuclear protein NIP30-domain-containing protein [Multifurca ochricompacta]